MTGYNPYQPPTHQDFPNMQPGPGGLEGEPLPWDASSALSVGWDRVKTWWPVLVFAPLVVGVISQGVSYGLMSVQAGMDPSTAPLMGLVTSVVELVLGAFFGVGMLRIFISAIRGQSPSFGTLFSGGDRFLPMLGTQLLYGLAIGLGFLALIIPGIILALGLAMAPYLCVDQNMSPVDALKASWDMMKGNKVNLFGFGLLAGLMCLVSILALFVGLFVAVAVTYAAYAWIYLRLRGENVPEQLV